MDLPVLIDPRDQAAYDAHSWHIVQGYAATNVAGKTVYLHRLLMQPPPDMEVDHLNFNKLDNRRANLEVVTPAENLRRARLHFGGWKGPQRSRCGRAVAGIRFNSKKNLWHVKLCGKHIGYTTTEPEAIEMRRRAELSYKTLQ
jgi:hypothetical protein